jgi:hypothetical protein
MTDFSALFLPRNRALFLLLPAAILSSALLSAGQSKPAAPSKPAANPAPDVLVLSNGDTLHGKFVNAVAGKVTFHSDPLGDVALTWDKIRELHVSGQYAVLNSAASPHGRRDLPILAAGAVEMSNQALTVHPANEPAKPPIPVKQAEYVLDQTSLRNMTHRPGFFGGWNGSATAGGTLVSASQNQYTVSGGLALARVVPEVGWLQPRNRTTVGFTGPFGKIVQPAYTMPAAPPATTTPTYVPAVTTKTAIYHAGAERDEYFSARFFALMQTAFDHNFSQSLALQQIYGGGIGWTALKTPRQEADLKATVQYESQQFLPGAVSTGTFTTSQNLIGSTFSANYMLHLKLLTYTQAISYIPAYNQMNAYSANETNTLAFPTYKRLSFSVGTMDTYLNDSPFTEPPTRPNSFQFTMGLTYAIKAKD